MKTLLANPVLIKEVKLRFRSLKSFTGILFYLVAMSIFVFGFIFLATSFSGNGYFRPDESFALFSMMTYIQLGLIVFITPALTAGTISTEREKQTLNILLTTSQTSFQIIFGKMTSSIAFLLLMIVSGLPIYSLVFLYGGVSPVQLLIIFLFFFHLFDCRLFFCFCHFFFYVFDQFALFFYFFRLLLQRTWKNSQKNKQDCRK